MPALDVSTPERQARVIKMLDELPPAYLHQLFMYQIDHDESVFTPGCLLAIRSYLYVDDLFMHATPSSPPAAPLVGIETNPGPTPTKRRAKKTTTVAVFRSGGRLGPTSRRRVKTRVSNTIAPGRILTNQYVDTLHDPWENPPMVLGYDTFQQTVLGTGYLRNSITVNTDGSFGLVFNPSATNCVMTNNAGVGVATWGTISLTNVSALTTQAVEGRVVSGGIRVMPLAPLTSAPGVLFTGTDMARNRNDFNALTITQLSNLPTSEISIGTRGSRAVFLPIDNDSYTFSLQPVSGYGISEYPRQPTLFVVGRGFPSGATIYYETILNLELLPTTSSQSIGVNSNSTPTSSLADLFPTPQSLYSSVKTLLGNAVTLDGAVGLDSLEPVGMAANVGRAIEHFTGSAFGHGKHYKTSLVAGSSARGIAREATTFIEEMKDGYGVL